MRRQAVVDDRGEVQRAAVAPRQSYEDARVRFVIVREIDGDALAGAQQV